MLGLAAPLAVGLASSALRRRCTSACRAGCCFMVVVVHQQSTFDRDDRYGDFDGREVGEVDRGVAGALDARLDGTLPLLRRGAGASPLRGVPTARRAEATDPGPDAVLLPPLQLLSLLQVLVLLPRRLHMRSPLRWRGSMASCVWHAGHVKSGSHPP